MKIYRLLTPLFFALALLSSCDVIDKPYEESDDPIVSDSGVVRKVLLEDYTGFLCPNCPDAVTVINQLHKIYKDNLIVIAVHADYFAIPTEDPHFKYNFRTVVGNQWFKQFEISDNPKGLINRLGFPTKQHIFAPAAWAERVSEALKLKADMKIEITSAYSIIDSTITADLNVLYLKGTDRKHKLSVVLVQDSIIDSQIVGGATDTAFVHNHVLRAAFNTPWGEDLNSAAIADSALINKKYILPIKTDVKHPWEAKHLKVVAFVYDTETYEVLQVEEIDVAK